MLKFFRKLLYFVLIVLAIWPSAGRAEFNYNNIISDVEAEDYDSMGQVEIKEFLKSHNSFLANYFYEGNNPGPNDISLDPEGRYFKERSAAEIIWNAAQEAQINPRFILTTLQKEMSLVEDSNPKENALSYAMGYGCPDGGGCDFRFKGLGKQIRSASLQFRHFLDNIQEYKHRPGQKSCVDDYTPYLPCTTQATEINPENKITAAMYIYTPHVKGNKLFRALWDKYGFGGAVAGPVLAGIFPEGALVKAKAGDDQTVYLIDDGLKLPFESLTALISRYDPHKVLEIAGEELVKYQTGVTIKYANYSILQSADKQKYLVDGLQKRLITSDEVFRKLGFNPEEVISVTDEDLTAFKNGEPINDAAQSPFGQLLQDMTSNTLYYVKDGKKFMIIDVSIAKANFPELKISEVTTRTLEKFSDTTPLKLADGTLIKKDKDPNVYVVSAGLRRLIPDGQTFETLGYSWARILVVPTKVMNFHILGDALNAQ